MSSSSNIENPNADIIAAPKSRNDFSPNLEFESKKFVRNNFEIQKRGYMVTYTCAYKNKSVKNPIGCKCILKLHVQYNGDETLTKIHEHTCADEKGEVNVGGVINIKDKVKSLVSEEAMKNLWKKPRAVCEEIMREIDNEYGQVAHIVPTKQQMLRQVYYDRSHSAGTEDETISSWPLCSVSRPFLKTLNDKRFFYQASFKMNLSARIFNLN